MTQWGLDALFNPAKRHMDEEKQRLQSTREEVGDNSGGKRIDFDSGKVKIRKNAADTAGESDTADESSEAPDSRDDATRHGRSKDDKPAPSPAAVRAAERRRAARAKSARR